MNEMKRDVVYLETLQDEKVIDHFIKKIGILIESPEIDLTILRNMQGF